MTLFASNRNSPAEERWICDLIIDTFDAVEVSGRGIERARQYARAALAESGKRGVVTEAGRDRPAVVPVPGSASPAQLGMDIAA